MEMSMARPPFFRAAYHNMRNPLVAVKGYAALMLDGCGGDLAQEHREWVEDLARNCGRLLDLINALSDLAFIEAGIASENPRHLDMRAVVEECAGALSSAAEARDVKVLMSLPKGEVQGSFDPMLLTRALSVLLKNAIEVTPSGGTVRIDMGDGDDTIDCSISDGGPGLSIEDCGRLVEGFFNGTQGEGTGVGVVIARRIAERYGGILRAEPGEDGTGSTVHFIIRKVREIS